MNSTLQIGPMVFQIQGLVILFATLIGYNIINYRLKRFEDIEGSDKNHVLETIEVAAIIAIALWKFSLILFDPVRVFNTPSSLLYFSGGARGIGLAVIAVLGYLYYRSKKKGISIWIYADLLAAGFLVGLGVYSLLALFGNLNRVWVFGSEVIITLLLYLQYFRKGKGTFENLNQALLWFSLGQVFLSFLNPLKQNLWWGFSKLQVVFLILGAFCIVIDFLVANRAKKVN